ncbi:hypothetical protein [Paenibacillus tianmuensis]|nr:hypothetical protein [Paenibacillus tianmuensis]
MSEGWHRRKDTAEAGGCLFPMTAFPFVVSESFFQLALIKSLKIDENKT